MSKDSANLYHEPHAAVQSFIRIKAPKGKTLFSLYLNDESKLTDKSIQSSLIVWLNFEILIKKKLLVFKIEDAKSDKVYKYIERKNIIK